MRVIGAIFSLSSYAEVMTLAGFKFVSRMSDLRFVETQLSVSARFRQYRGWLTPAWPGYETDMQ